MSGEGLRLFPVRCERSEHAHAVRTKAQSRSLPARLRFSSRLNGIQHYLDPGRLRHQLVQQLQPLRRQLGRDKTDACEITARTRQTGDKARLGPATVARLNTIGMKSLTELPRLPEIRCPRPKGQRLGGERVIRRQRGQPDPSGPPLDESFIANMFLQTGCIEADAKWGNVGSRWLLATGWRIIRSPG